MRYNAKEVTKDMRSFGVRSEPHGVTKRTPSSCESPGCRPTSRGRGKPDMDKTGFVVALMTSVVVTIIGNAARTQMGYKPFNFFAIVGVLMILNCAIEIFLFDDDC